MNEIDARLLWLMDLLKREKIIANFEQFYSVLGIQRQVIYKIQHGQTHFTVAHITIICQTYRVDANWVFGRGKYVFLDKKSVCV